MIKGQLNVSGSKGWEEAETPAPSLGHSRPLVRGSVAVPTPGQPAQALHDCSPEAWRPRAGRRVPAALCKPVGLRPGRIWGFFSQFPFSGLWNCALGPQSPTPLWCLAPRGPSTRAGLGVRALGISPPRTVTTAAVPWQCAVDNQSSRPRGGLCDRRVPTSAAAWVVPRTPGGLIAVAAGSFRSASQLCPLCPRHPFPNAA